MNQYSTSFSLLLERLDTLSSYSVHAQSTPPKVSFVQRNRHKIECKLLASSIVDVQRHAAALIGYFEGYDARGSFQSDFVDADNVQDLASCLKVLDHVVATTRIVVARFAKGDGTLAKNGPTKPGPERTLVVACEHVEGLITQLRRILVDSKN